MDLAAQPSTTHPRSAPFPCTPLPPPQLAFQRIRELQSTIEDGRLAAAAKDARLAELEGELAAAQVGGP